MRLCEHRHIHGGCVGEHESGCMLLHLLHFDMWRVQETVERDFLRLLVHVAGSLSRLH